jgi:transcriptional regulator with XRE-family HTH domain
MSKKHSVSNKVISERIRVLREVRNLKSKEVAEQIGMHPRVYSSYETGEYTIDGETLAKLANILNIDIAYFFTSEEISRNIIREQLEPVIFCNGEEEKKNIILLIQDLNSINPRSIESLLNLVKTIRGEGESKSNITD